MRSFCSQHLVNEAVLDVDAAGAGAAQFPDHGLLGRRLDVGVVGQKLQQGLGLLLESRRWGRELAGVLLSLPGEQNRPAHQSGSLLSSLTSVAMPSRIDSRIPGIATRCRVSWMARQSSSESRTALLRLPVICTGSWDCPSSSIKA